MSLPTGTVTFLFTDIEGSTHLWERHPEGMPTVLARHDGLLRQAVEAEAGQVIKSTGDGVHAVFAAGAAGLRASLAAQQALKADQWDEISPDRIAVRMALHSGEAELRAGDYYGSVLNRAARLMAVAHGGQILVSAATAEIVGEQLPAGASWLDLGAHRLKDLVRPEHAYQFVHPALRREFPPLRSVDAFPNNLPVQLTSLIGREREAAEVKQKLAATHLLTLVGPGGTGKTRLALQLAADVLPTFADGVWFIELDRLSEASLIPPALAAVLGLRSQVGMAPLDVIVNYLRPKTALLVLDNCEHVIDGCARLADQLLHVGPHLRILASSREALGLDGEMIYAVPSLRLPDPAQPGREVAAGNEAVQLFVERATAANPRFALTEANAPHIAQICRQLDGIPLAIELAAVRSKVFSPEQIAARLDDRFQMLTGGSRGARPRQQTLRALIDWSYELLTDAERRLLRRLSVFSGGWTYAAVEAVGADLDVLEALTQLVNKSLVGVDDTGGEPRYRFLETIRQYGRDRLAEAGEQPDARDRHLAYFLDLAQRSETHLSGPELFDWLSRLEAEHDNFRTALEWALEANVPAALTLASALWGFWFRRGHGVEGIDWISAALARAERLPSVAGDAAQPLLRRQAAAWHALASLSFLNDNATALRASQVGSALARQLGDQSSLAMNLAIAAATRMQLGDAAGARPELDESLSLARATGDRVALGFALSVNAQYRSLVDHDPITAQADDEAGLALLSSYAASWAATQALYVSARGAAARGDYTAARARFVQALPRYEQMGDPHRVNMIQSELAHLDRYAGRYQQAEAGYRTTIRVWQRLGHRAAIAHQLESFGLVAQAQARPERAARLFAAGEALRETIGTPMNSNERTEYDRAVAELRDTQLPDSLAAWWAEGRRMSVEQAVDDAVGLANTSAPGRGAGPT